MVKLLLQREPSGVLRMAAVDGVADRFDSPLGLAFEPGRARGFPIHRRHLLARPQISEGVGTLRRRDAIGDAAARAALVDAEHKTRPFGRTPVHERIDAQRAVQPDHARRRTLQIFEARPPDQRAIAEHPEIIGCMIEIGIHGRTHKERLAIRPRRLPQRGWTWRRKGRTTSSLKRRIRRLHTSHARRTDPAPLAADPDRSGHCSRRRVERALVLRRRPRRNRDCRLARARGQGRTYPHLRLADRRRISAALRDALRRSGA